MLSSMFNGQVTPAVGISLGVDRLLAGLIEMELLKTQTTPSHILVGVFSESERILSYHVASKLRAEGLNQRAPPKM